MASPTPLAALAALISSGTKTLEDAYAKAGTSFPALDQPFAPTPLDDDPELGATARIIVAAAHQIIATVRGPLETFQDYAPAMYMSAALAFANETHIADALKDQPQGLHVNDISAKIGIDAVKIARVLRYLATRHVFKEVSPSVFANNRISSVLVKAQPLSVLRSNNTVNKYEGAPAAAFVGHLTDESFHSAVALSAHAQGQGSAGYGTPFSLAHKTKKTIWEWYEEPDSQFRGLRFTAAMKGGGDRYPTDIFTGALDWAALKKDSVVVDVGGSIGSVTLILAKAFPHLKYVVQDVAPVIPDAEKFWAAQAPELIESGRVTLQEQDFFQPQALKTADVYHMRFVIHDWPDNKNEIILKHLRAAAGPSSKVVVFDMVMPYASPDPAGPPPPPFPLLANLGLAHGGFVTMMDLHMLNILDGQERTRTQFIELAARTGWKFEGVKLGILAAFVFSAA